MTPSTATVTAASYVPNAYFSFPYAATYLANAGYCSAAISQCSANYAACTSQLEGQGGGAGYAVTILVPGGGGTTVAGGGATYNAASATSICKKTPLLYLIGRPSVLSGTGRDGVNRPGGLLTESSSARAGNSLSSVACGGLQPSMCTMSGVTAGGFYFGTESGNAAAARPTAAAAAACAGLVGAVAAGMAGLGIL